MTEILDCRKCRLQLPIENFQTKSGSIYKTHWCRDCRRAYDRQRYKDDPEPKRAIALAWAKSNPERHNELTKAWSAKNPEKQKAAIKTWEVNNVARCRARWHKRRARVQANGGEFTAEEWLALKVFYNFTCLCCGKSEPTIKLTLDHVKPIFLGGSNTIDNIQPLCKECNSRKGHRRVLDFRPERMGYATAQSRRKLPTSYSLLKDQQSRQACYSPAS